jgi:hypothetical protein
MTLCRLRTEVEQEIRGFLKAQYEDWASRYSQDCQQQIRAAQYVLLERNKEVLAINAGLRSELADAQREIEAYKEQLRQREASTVAPAEVDANLAGLPNEVVTAKERVTAPGVSKVGVKSGKGGKRAKRKEGKE